MNVPGSDFRFGLILAIAFFVMGTFILYLFYISMSTAVARFAFQFTILAIIVHWIVAGYLLFKFLRQRLRLAELLKTFGVMMVNIPVGIFYSYLMTVLLDYARIEFINPTGQVADNVRLDGCKRAALPALSAGASHLEWIKLQENCTLVIEYTMNRKSVRDTVLVKLSPGNGLRMTHLLVGAE